MSDDDMDPVFANAMETLMEVEGTRRDALGRLGFRQRAEMVMHFEKRLGDIARTEAMEAAEMEAAGVAPPPPTDLEAEQRQAVEEREDLFGRRRILLDEAEAWYRMMMEHMFFELADCINGAFKPCVTKVYSYAWGTYVYKVLPVKPHALDKLGKHNERHLPEFMWTENIQKTDSFVQFTDQEHAEQFKHTVETLEAPMQPLQITA